MNMKWVGCVIAAASIFAGCDEVEPLESELAEQLILGDAGDALPSLDAEAMPRTVRGATSAIVTLDTLHFDVDVLDTLADVTVVQHFQSHTSTRSDALYTFPLPTDAAVVSVVMHLGDEQVELALMSTGEAEAAHAEATDEGRCSMIVTELRPNRFQARVTNIPAEAAIEVELRYTQPVAFDHGRQGITLPQHDMPRFGDASPSSPPPREVTADVRVQTQAELIDLSSPGHTLEITDWSDDGVAMQLSREPGSSADMVVQWHTTATEAQYSLLTHEDERGGFFQLVVYPPTSMSVPVDPAPREVLFVVDVSGSMIDGGLRTAQAFVRQGLAALRPGDTFNVLPFSTQVDTFADHSVTAAPGTLADAEAFVDTLRAGGGTELSNALTATLQTPLASGYVGVIVLLTDGGISNDDVVLRALLSSLGNRRAVAIGVGQNPNRFVLEGLAEIGQGAAHFVLPGEGVDQAVSRTMGEILSPMLTDLQVDWGQTQVNSVVPAVLPDLVDGQPLIVRGRYDGPFDDVWVEATSAEGTRAWTSVPLEPVTLSRPALAYAWARDRIVERELDRLVHQDPTAAEDIEALSLAFGVLSSQTAYTGATNYGRVSAVGGFGQAVAYSGSGRGSGSVRNHQAFGAVHGVGGIENTFGESSVSELQRRTPRAGRLSLDLQVLSDERSDVIGTLRRHRRGYRYCVERELPLGNNATLPLIEVVLRVGEDGRVIADSVSVVHPDGTPMSTHLQQCLGREARRQRFDAGDPIEVRFSLSISL